jgi:8-oxo-dGTP diphosphatase
MPQRRAECVACLLANPTDGTLLLQQRDSNPAVFPLCWTAFGGTVEPGESAIEAAVRELKEELSLTIELQYWITYEHEVLLPTESVLVKQNVFSGTLPSDTSGMKLNEGRAMEFFKRDGLAALQIAFNFNWLFEHFFDNWRELYSEP